MDIHVALDEVARWCAEQTRAGNPDAIEVECHATVWITVGESAPPWHVRRERRCSAGASVPFVQLRYDVETRQWALHHMGQRSAGWCGEDDAVCADEVRGLLDEIAGDRSGRFRGLPQPSSATLPIPHRGRSHGQMRRVPPYAVRMAELAIPRLSEDERRVIERWIERLRSAVDVESVWLFGSRARGEGGGADSDVDLLVITRGDPKRDRGRAWELIDEAARELGANPAVYVPHTWDRAWLENRRQIQSFFVQEVDRDKIVLFGEP